MHLRRYSNDAPVPLGPMLGQGGEGRVFPVRGAPDIVAKLYKKTPTPEKVEKLLAMTKTASPAILRVAAWPIDLLKDEKGVVQGFLMPKVSSREDVHELYSPKSRRQAFPQADFRFVVRAAANVARAFAVVHSHGHVLGDVNHGNALIGHDGTVVLIDCDSFQIKGEGKSYTCDVGVPLFTSPELQGRAFRGLHRTPDHDGFGLAVLLFHLLFVGRHPYAGVHTSGDMPIERAIAESRFVYGSAGASLGMSPPPGTLPLGAFGARIAQLFERAFAMPGAHERPTPLEWIHALEELESNLTVCPVAAQHYFPSAADCCWCDIESRVGMAVFGPQKALSYLFSAEKLDALWGAIAQVHRPVANPPGTPGSQAAAAAGEGWDRLARIAASWFLAFFGLSALLLQPGQNNFMGAAALIGAVVLRVTKGWSSFTLTSRRAKRNLAWAERRWKAVVEKWNAECSTEPFDNAFKFLRETRESLANVGTMRKMLLKAVEQRRVARQKERFLSSFRIADAKLPRLMAAEIQRLALRNWTTAKDVPDIRRQLHTFLSAPALAELVAWYEEHERNFRFDPTEPLDPEDLKRVEKMVRTRQDEMVQRLRDGPSTLAEKQKEILRARQRMQKDVEAAWRELRDARRKAGLNEDGTRA